MPRYPRIAVRAIITDLKGRILILQRASTKYASGLWELPGGKVEYRETLEKALKLEIHEETALEITDLKFFTYLDGIPKNKKLPHFVTLIFICKANGIVHINHESSDFRWISKNDICSYAFAFKNEEAIKTYWKI